MGASFVLAISKESFNKDNLRQRISRNKRIHTAPSAPYTRPTQRLPGPPPIQKPGANKKPCCNTTSNAPDDGRYVPETCRAIILVISDHELISVWWYQKLYNTIFALLTMSTWCSKHVEAWNKLIVKQILCIKLVDIKK